MFTLYPARKIITMNPAQPVVSDYRLSVGPERASRMNACRTALDNNVPLAIHSRAIL